jgi:hypothetical protein
MREYIVSGVPLRDPVGAFPGVYFLDYTRSELDGDISRTITSGADFGFHGSLPDVDNYFGTSRETLTINLAAADKDEYATYLRALQGLFGRRDFQVITAPQRSPLAAGSGRDGRSFAVDPSLLREARMRAVGGIAVERLNEKTGRLKVILENIWGFYRSTQDYTSAPVPVAAASAVISLTVAGDSTAPINTGLVRVKGPVAAGGFVRLMDVNSVKGIGLKFPTALAATEYAIVDLATLKAVKQTTDTWATTGGTNITTTVDPNGEGVVAFDPGPPAGGWPAAGYAYSYTLLAGGFTAGSTTVEVRLRRSYLS